MARCCQEQPLWQHLAILLKVVHQHFQLPDFQINQKCLGFASTNVLKRDSHRERGERLNGEERQMAYQGTAAHAP
eukprot:13787470-Alexandrium_andersonii.AAC.1